MCMNWLITLIAYAISGLVWEINESSYRMLIHLSIYHNIFLNLSKLMIRIYWCACWFTRQLPYLLEKVRYNILNSLISNSLVKHCLKVCLLFSSFPIMMMLSTYTRRVVTPKFECLMNNVWFSWLCLYPYFSSL